MKPERNDPCPCGSGKKYKKCCLPHDADNLLRDLKAKIHDLIDSREFRSMEEFEEAMAELSQDRNTTPLDDFHGLSSMQVHKFLHAPFANPELAFFPPVLGTEPDTEAAFLLDMLLHGVGENGMKLTAKGNPGRKFCQECWQRYQERFPDPIMQDLSIRAEPDFEPLHVTRIVAGKGGLVRKSKGRLLLTARCRKAMEQGGMRTLYPMFFQAYAWEFNWGYRDRHQEIPLVQQAFLFSLYLLHRYGDSWRPATFYSDCFQQAFPMLLQEVEPSMFDPPDKVLENCYILRTFHRFACFLGLARLKEGKKSAIDYARQQVRATPLLAEMVLFHVP